jgi:CHAT domain/Clp amino terminal domain, pathogenicity island component
MVKPLCGPTLLHSVCVLLPNVAGISFVAMGGTFAVFERFSDDAADVMIAAQAEARQLHRAEVGTDHLLLAFIKVRPAFVGLVPGKSSLLARARAAAVSGSAVQNGHAIPYDACAWQVIEEATRLARITDTQIEPEHFLLAILRQPREISALRVLTALRVDQSALMTWCSHSLAERGRGAKSGTAQDLAETWRVANPLQALSWSRWFVELYRRPILWGASTELPRRWHRVWFLVSSVVSICYAGWAATVYFTSYLPGAERRAWDAALLVTELLALGALAYWSFKAMAAMAEGWRVAGVVRGCLVVLGYLMVGLLPLALTFGLAVVAAVGVFGTARFSFALHHLSTASPSTQLLWVIFTPMGLALLVFASFAPYWHYSVGSPIIRFWVFANSVDSAVDAIDEEKSLLPQFDELFSGVREHRYTAFGADFVEQVISYTRAAILAALYQILGDETYLDEALATARMATDICLRNQRITPYYFHAKETLEALANTLWMVYQVRPDEEALRDAIWAREQLARVFCLERSVQNRIENAHKLARLHIALYELTGESGALDRGQTVARLAASAAGPSYGSASVLLTLGQAEELGSALAEAEAAYRAGADQRQQDDDDDAPDECRYRLAVLLARRSRRTGEQGIGEEAVRILRSMVGEPDADSGHYREDLSPERRARLMIGFADVLVSAGGADQGEPVALYRAAAAITEASAIVRVEAACGWGYHAVDPDDAAQGLERAVELLALAAAPGLGYPATRRQLGRWAELPVDAAAAQLRVGRTERAVELLEHGRTVMWSRRTAIWDAPLDQIESADPLLRKRLTAIQSELLGNVLTTTGRQDPGRQNVAAERRTELTREWQRIVSEVGLGRPAPFAELKAAADDGPVVLLSVSRSRSDALILSRDQSLGHLCLPTDIYVKARAVIDAGVAVMQALDAVDGLPDLDQASEAEMPVVIAAEDHWRHAAIHHSFLMRQMLAGWLWSEVTEPVLRWLAEHGKLTGENGSLPRLWWCPTGSLTFLPLHAAGSRNSPIDSVMDRVVSSYTPNLGQLVHARELVPEQSGRILILAPDSAMRYAQTEADQVADRFPAADVMVAKGAITESSLREISRSAVMHFVGHGVAPALREGHGRSFSAGGLMIGSPSAPSFLSAQDLAALPQARARFAYLSVCEAATPDSLVPDEATHPAAVLHFGGFPNVIATLHPIPDESGVQVAAAVYDAIVRGGVLDERRSARALHDALHTVRRKEPGWTAPWTTYMHIGP